MPNSKKFLIFFISTALTASPLYADDGVVVPDDIDFSKIGTVLPEVHEDSMPGVLRDGAEAVCEEPGFIETPPFFVSSLLKDYDQQPGTRKIVEPLTYPVANGKKAQKGVPSFSILKLLTDFNLSLIGPQALATVLVDIEVLSLPNEQAIIEMRTNRRLAGAANLPLAEEGSQGQFRAGAMRFVPDFVFKVKDPKVLSFFPEIERFLTNASTSIRFTSKDGRYLARRCCKNSYASRTSILRDGSALSPACRNEYVFEVVADRQPGDYLKQYYDNTYNNELFTALFPIQKDNLIPLSNVLHLIEEPGFDFVDFKYFDTRGFVKIPLDKPENFRNSKNVRVAGVQKGPLDTVHYRSDDPNNNDAFGDPTSICAFFQAVKKYNTLCNTPECRIQWGDFYHSDRWVTHRDHDQGSCVDIRPMRKTEGYGPIGIYSYVKKCTKNEDGTQKCQSVAVLNRDYDRARTQQLVDILKAAGGVGKADAQGNVIINNVLFNDTRGIRGVTRSRGHDNHIHVCFPPEHEKVQATCDGELTL